MTLGRLLPRYPALAQYEIMARADRLLPCGRYYGGQLTPEQLALVTDRLKTHDEACDPTAK